jgi:hypothetical protein
VVCEEAVAPEHRVQALKAPYHEICFAIFEAAVLAEVESLERRKAK